MAKKSSKKSGGLVLKAIVVLLGILAICMAFLPFVNKTGYGTDLIGSGTVSLTGFQAAFGATAVVDGSNLPGWTYFGASKATISGGSFSYSLAPLGGVTATLVIAIAALAIGLVSFLAKDKKVCGIILGVAGLLFITAGIMFFFPVKFGGFESKITEGILGKAGVEYTLGIGAILSAIFSLIAGLVSLGATAISFKK